MHAAFVPDLAWALPFVGMLLAIAILPLAAPRFWESNIRKLGIAALLGAPVFALYAQRCPETLVHAAADYVSFIVLLGGLFVISGGILLEGDLEATPRTNALFLGTGALLASFVGTTGASMLLIRPLLQTNRERKHVAHTVVFFIFLVSNIGGCLTPLGDPPLFLGFLHHVPFFWTLRLLPITLAVAVPLLLVFYAVDRRYYRREEAAAPTGAAAAMAIRGGQNFVYLAGILGAVLMSGTWKLGTIDVLGIEMTREGVLRDALLVAIGVLSLKTTSASIHKDNQFSWFPIKEVAILFAGIFMTIIPALAILKAGTHGALKPLVDLADQPADYFWLTGGLSSFLDNAPTYLTFFNTALGALAPDLPEAQAVLKLVHTGGPYLLAISAGAVFMGANTYIGNAPNFMVKSIAEESGVQMPSFFGYMFKYSIPFLIPLFLIVTFVFFR